MSSAVYVIAEAVALAACFPLMAAGAHPLALVPFVGAGLAFAVAAIWARGAR